MTLFRHMIEEFEIELKIGLVSEGIVKKYLKNIDTSKSVNSENSPAWVSKL